MLKIITIIFAIIISAILLLQIDDDLNPEIAPFLAKGVATAPNDAYFYLMGIDAPAGENPLEAGKKKYAAIDQTKSIFDEHIPADSTVRKNKLTLPEGKYFGYAEKDYLSAMFSANDVAQVLAENAVLLERYQTLIEIKGYQTVTNATLSETFPNYSYLTKGNKLLFLKTINTAKTSGVEKAIPLLTDNLSALRMQLKNADNLVGKLIYTLLISESLDVLSILVHQQKSFSAVNIAPISLAERKFDIVMSREFAMAYDALTQLDRSPDFFTHTGALKGEFDNDKGSAPGWWVRAIYKPNMSANGQYLFYKEIVALSQLEQAEFASITQETKKKDEELLSVETSYIRNAAGSILLNIASPAFEGYTALLFDLNAKIAIFNQTANKAELPTDLSNIQNPYYDKADTAYYSEDKKSICLTGPLNDDKNRRCLRLKL